MSKSYEIRRIFKDRGLAPKKYLGQNLLVDNYYLSRIISAAAVYPGEHIMEIGAGLGVLTKALMDAGAYVSALELDSGFFDVLKQKFGTNSQVSLVHCDALKYDFTAAAAERGRLKIVANLPYSISSRLLFNICEKRTSFSSLAIMLQKEVADRLEADPGTKEYGVLTVILGLTAKVKSLFNIPPKAFHPAPEVVSSFLVIEFPNEAPVPVLDYQLTVRLIKAAFASRRKTLANNLKSPTILGLPFEVIEQSAEESCIDLRRRGESLSPVEFASFADALTRKKLSSRVSNLQ